MRASGADPALVIALLLLSLASATLDDADAALRTGDLERCGQLAQLALASGDLEEPELSRAWLLRGRCYALAGDRDRAERCYAVAVRTSPDHLAWLSGGAPGDADEPFHAALAARPAEPLRARARVAADHVEVMLEADDLSLVRTASLWRNDEEQARLPLELGASPSHRVAGIPVDGLSLRLHDKHGNTLWRGPVEVASLAAAKKEIVVQGGSEAREPTMLTTLGAAALGVGLLGAVACGIGASAGGVDELQQGGVWLVGVGASTGVFLIGAALVVVDQGL